MKNTLVSISLAALFVTGLKAQTYLPLTGGTLSGNLVITSGNQLQVPYCGFNSGNTQPSNSGNVAIFPNTGSYALDIVGWSNGWHFVPSSNTSYSAPVVTIDQVGNIKTNSSLSIFSNQFGQQIQMRDATGGSTIWWMGISDAVGDNFTIGDGTTNSNRLNIQKGTGNVGIGTTNPQAMLDVNGAIHAKIESHFTWTGTFTDPDPGVVHDIKSGANGIGVYGNSVFSGGYVLIGAYPATMKTSYLLNVNGPARVNQLVVNTTGADFVFEPGYQLAPLSKVEEFIKANHHLQGIAPAAQMQKDGVDVGDNQTKLLQKVEELTLYIIEQDKKTEAQNKLLQQQQTMLEKMQKEIDALQSPAKK